MSEPTTLGSYLRVARRRRGYSIEMAAEQTRIRAEFLMRIESDELDFLAPAYVRGFIATYARFLRVDPDPLLLDFERRVAAPVNAAQIAALERHSRRSIPRERTKLNSWAVAAIIASIGLITLAAIGLAAGPEEEPQRRATAPSESPSPSASASAIVASASPSPSAETVVFTDGIDLEIVAANDPCWIDVTADGDNVFTGILEVGQTESFSAEEEMTLVLGYPEGVELIVNGQNIGSPGGVNPVTIQLPEDIDNI